MKSDKQKAKQAETQLEFLEKIKKLAIIAMFSDDELMNRVVLKGGNAIDLIYKQASARASIDIDFSIETEFEQQEFEIIDKKIRNVLEETYLKEGLFAFDIKFVMKPLKIAEEVSKFWGGYQVEFKVISREEFEKNKEDIELLRRNASVVGPMQQRVFKIDISKFEYCGGKKPKELDGYTIYVYTPEMLVIEKLRAICQQMPEYKEIIKTKTMTPRPRDFFDIYMLIDNFLINLKDNNNIFILKAMFEAKRVPLSFLKNIEKYREFHREEFPALKDTIKPTIKLKDFDFYFDYVVGKAKELGIQ